MVHLSVVITTSLYLYTVYLLKPASNHSNVTPNLHKVKLLNFASHVIHSVCEYLYTASSQMHPNILCVCVSEKEKGGEHLDSL